MPPQAHGLHPVGFLSASHSSITRRLPLKRILCFVLLLPLAVPTSARAQFKDVEEKQGKRGEGDPFGAKAEAKAWEEYLETFGNGPVYRVEALYREQADG